MTMYRNIRRYCVLQTHGDAETVIISLVNLKLSLKMIGQGNSIELILLEFENIGKMQEMGCQLV